MIDKRLLQLHGWISQQQDRVNRGRQGANEVWAVTAKAALADYFKNLLAQMSSALPDDELVSSFVQQSPLAELRSPVDTSAPWPAAIMGDIEASLLDPSNHDHPVADWLIASALFDALVSRGQPSTDGVHVARLIADNSTRVHAFSEAVAASSTSELGALVAAMRSFIQDECSHPENHLTPGFRPALGLALEAWEAEKDVGAVWATREWAGLDMLPERLGMLMPLVAVRPADLLPLIEEIQPFPLQKSCFYWRSVTLDLDKVLEMLDSAPVVIAQQSGLWNRKVVAPLLLQTAFGVIGELSTNRQYDGTPLADDTELACIAKTIIERAIKRPDGVPLVSRWMQHQVHAAASRASESTFVSVFNASFDAFAQAKVGPSDVYPLMSKAHPKGCVLPVQLAHGEAKDAYEQLLLAGMLTQERAAKDEHDQVESLRPAFIGLMRNAREPFSLGYGEVMPNWRHRVFANIYVAEAEAARSWREDFDLFAPERRAALHFSYFDDNSLMAPSLFLAGVGLSLIDRCLEVEKKPQLLQQGMVVWKAVFEATQLLFTHWSLSNDAWRNMAASLFARYPGCLRAQSSSDSSKEQPVEWLSLLGRDEGLVANALANLLNNGMDADVICGKEPAVEEMQRRMRNYLKWEGGAGSRALNPGVRHYLINNFVGKTTEIDAR